MISGVDLEMHVRLLTAAAFLPNQFEIDLSNVLNPNPGCWSRLWRFVFGGGAVHSQMGQLVRPYC